MSELTIPQVVAYVKRRASEPCKAKDEWDHGYRCGKQQAYDQVLWFLERPDLFPEGEQACPSAGASETDPSVGGHASVLEERHWAPKPDDPPACERTSTPALDDLVLWHKRMEATALSGTMSISVLYMTLSKVIAAMREQANVRA